MSEEQSDSSKKDIPGRTPVNEDRVRFFLELHYKEVAAFWTRKNVFLVVMAAGLAGVATVKGDEYVKFVIALLALVVTAAWLRVYHMSCYYQDRWMGAARGLFDEAPGLDVYRGPLNLDGKRNRFVPRRPGGPGATKIMYVVILAFLGAWGGVCFKYCQF